MKSHPKYFYVFWFFYFIIVGGLILFAISGCSNNTQPDTEPDTITGAYESVPYDSIYSYNVSFNIVKQGKEYVGNGKLEGIPFSFEGGTYDSTINQLEFNFLLPTSSGILTCSMNLWKDNPQYKLYYPLSGACTVTIFGSKAIRFKKLDNVLKKE